MGAQCVRVDGPIEDFKSPGIVMLPGRMHEEVVQGLDDASEEDSSPTPTNVGIPLCHQPLYITEEDNDEATPVVIPGLLHPCNASIGSVTSVKPCRIQDQTPETLTSRLLVQKKLVAHEDVTFHKELCNTLKSTVCLADWKGQTVVAKRIKKSLLKEEDAKAIETRDVSMREMLHELKIFTTISHPCIVNFIGAGFERGQGPVFLTEYMEGGDVESYMKKQRETSLDHTFKPKFSLAMQWILSTAEALAYLHGLPQPIIHRDLKPLNLLLTKELKLKVTDLGLSKVMPGHGQKASDPVKMTGGVGTWRYMAPEMVRHEHYTDRIDIYALALIAYFLLSGRQPFDSFCRGDVENILKAYLKGQEPRPELDMFTGSMEMRAFLQEAWHPEASRRPSAAECAERLAEISTHGLLHSVGVFSKNLKRNLQPFARSTTA
ncbi:unnamed protein product [Durusdinium trenchii]|uniref:Protein kinase domain-containing protein n=1 Tax=Durusdinium trenchii TaxID=1381693 RepID=A0ABP0IGY7_9DINO